jgi:hypothetical protein
MLFRRIVLPLAAAALAAGGLAACHKPPDVACQYFARPNHRVVEAWWYELRSGYYCRSVNPTGVRDNYLVREFPGERYVRIDY